MSNLGPVYEDDEDYSPSRMNAKGIIRDTGTNIMALAASKQIGLAIPTDTSAGLVKNVAYYVDYDSSFNRITFEPLFHRHTHSVNANSDEDGGSYLSIRHTNISEFADVQLTHLSDDTQTTWTTSASGGSITFESPADDAYHQLNTNAVAGNYITATLPGVKYQWDNPLKIQMQIGCTENANILIRAGIGNERIHETPSTSRRQMAIEGCDGHGTNWVMLNANGNSASLEVTATTIPLLDNKDTILLDHIPADSCNVYRNGTLNATSTTNIADDGASEMARLFRWGVKLQSGTDDIQFLLYYLKMLGNHSAN